MNKKEQRQLFYDIWIVTSKLRAEIWKKKSENTPKIPLTLRLRIDKELNTIGWEAFSISRELYAEIEREENAIRSNRLRNKID